MKILKSITASTLVTILTITPSAFALDGGELFAGKACLACHGPEGKTPITNVIPKLAGQNKGYLIQQITDIKSGDRANGGTAQMKGIVAGLSDEEIEAIAEYLSSL